MGRCYDRIQYEERMKVDFLRQEGYSVSEIARRLHRNKSTISRELGRFPRSYQPIRAQYQAEAAARWRRRGQRKLDSSPELWKKVVTLLKKRWSPEQVSQHLRAQHPSDPAMHISHESIYTYIYVLPRGQLKKDLISCLRQEKKSRYRRTKTARHCRKVQEMISIEERPKSVRKRSLPGHWEGDLLVGKHHRSALGTLVERKTRAVILVPLEDDYSPARVRRAFERAMKNLPSQMRRSLTYDQGVEMREHKLFTKNTKMKVYFCHPASPWERGTCENTNGLIRDYFPKRTDFTKISRREIRRVQDELNERPRKTLGYKTPKEAFDQEVLKSLR